MIYLEEFKDDERGKEIYRIFFDSLLEGIINCLGLNITWGTFKG